MTRILCVKLLKQINFSVRGIYTSLYFLLGLGIFKLIATCIKAIVITSSTKIRANCLTCVQIMFLNAK